MKSLKETPKNKIFIGICLAFLAVILFLFIYTGRNYGYQAWKAIYPSVEFEGEYKVADGDWQPYIKGKHIPANQGDVTLKGYFRLVFPTEGEVVGRAEEGTVLAFYFNHIGGAIAEGDMEFDIIDAERYVTSDGEETTSIANEHKGSVEDMCGVMYIGYECRSGDEITIRLHNPHKFGNAYAVDEFLNNVSIYGGTDFERDMLNRGSVDRVWGMILILFACMILGTAIFSTLIHVKGSGNLWLVGFIILSAGLYFIFKSHGVIFFSEIIKFNTRMLVGSMMLYMLMLTAFVAVQLSDKARQIGIGATSFATISVLAFMLAPILADVKFYDMLPFWAAVQGFVCLVMMILLTRGFFKGGREEKVFSALGMLPMVAFLIDVSGVGLGLWQGGIASEIVFVLIFVAALILLLNIVPKNLNAATRARELETEKASLNAELTEKRIATMISQIQPHFIYNTLGTIEQLCITEPEAASKLVRNFSLYLRGNFSKLDNAKLIRFSEEMDHVKHYTDIEQVRFPDMTIQYDLRSVEFLLPALTVQPLVENAIKHGLMGLEEGGIVTISAYETESEYVIEVQDDGVGFDVNAGYDESKHVGIKNIRGRIEALCDGTLAIESEVGHGTKATLKIPKEATENDSNNG